MSLTAESMTPADFAAITGNRNNGWGGESGLEWIIILFLFALFNGGWGGNGFGGGNGAVPFVMNQGTDSEIQRGFNHSAVMDGLNGLTGAVNAGFGNVQNALCGGFAGVNAGIAAVQNGITQQMYANQIADLERSFAAQTANTQGMNALQAQLAQCCCDNRAATADLKHTIATENCADRTQSLQNTRDIIESQTRSTQAILDKLCQLELDNVKQENQNLRTQLNMANLAASQTAQTAELRTAQATTANQLMSELRSCPIPAQPVYGSQPIFTCGANSGCGCGCGASA